MKVFRELYGNIFILEEEKLLSNEYLKYLENSTQTSKTEAEIDNKGDILGYSDWQFITSLCKNKISRQKLIIKQYEKTKDTSTFLGRKIKELTGTGDHGGDAEDNQRDRKAEFSVRYLREIASDECKKFNVDIFEEPNIKNQYGSSFVQNMSFLKTKLYKILCFQNDFKDDSSKHRNKSAKNRNIIMKMLEKEKNEFFISLMKATLYDYEKIGGIIRNHLSLDEKDEKLIEFKDKAASLINEIESKLKKARKKENKIINYITIEQLDN